MPLTQLKLGLLPLGSSGQSAQPTGKGNPTCEQSYSVSYWQPLSLSFSRWPAGLAVNTGELPGECRAAE